MKVLIINGSGACVDCDTEYFNGYEWKKISEYKEREQVLNYNSETNEGLLTFPIKYIKEPCEKMYHFYDDVFGIDQVLSSEHQIIDYEGKKVSVSEILENQESTIVLPDHFIYGHNTYQNGIIKIQKYIRPSCSRNEYITKDGYKYCFEVPLGNLILRRNNKIFITGNSGKDTFVDQLETLISVYRHSTIDTIKDIAESHFGWDGEKNAKGRKLLSDLKIASIKYNDMPHNEMKTAIDYAEKSGQYDVFTCMIRDISEIEKAVNDPCLKDKIVTILITSNRTKNNTYGNVADDNVMNYIYDYYIDNSGTIEDLKESAQQLLIDLNILEENNNEEL